MKMDHTDKIVKIQGLLLGFRFRRVTSWMGYQPILWLLTTAFIYEQIEQEINSVN